ncbi:MAG: hypothetical protein EAZ97_01010, partial [Bacteroidetes bacterium]
DTFFKFLLEDTNIAKKLLSAIIEEDIISLDLRPQELLFNIPEKYLSVLRIDFKAIIRTKEGNLKKVLIEMQKTRVLFDVMRFRKYLSDNYAKQDEIITESGNTKENLPIITIYFLNFKLENINFPLLKIARNYTNLVSKEIFDLKNEFIENLTHDCYAIQIPLLRLNMQNRVEKLLSVFNQKYVTNRDQKIMHLPPEWNDDPELKAMIERLNYPLQNEEMVLRAEAEDEIESKFEEMERKLASSEKEKERLLAEKDQILLQAEQAKAEILLQAEQEKAEMLLQTEQKETLAIENFLRLGLNSDQIAISLQISKEKVVEIKNKLGI